MVFQDVTARWAKNAVSSGRLAYQIRKNWPKPIERCGGNLIGYFLPTKFAGRTDSAIALIDFPSLAAYEEYRKRLMEDPDAKQNVAHAERSGCILLEDRSFLKWVGSGLPRTAP